MGLIPLRSNPIWYSTPEFEELVQNPCASPIHGLTKYIWVNKKRVKMKMKKWSRNERGALIREYEFKLHFKGSPHSK
jgi:hypothetical protein